MKIRDRVYGTTELSEPLLIELIDSQPLRRLKNIAQFGVPDKYYRFPGFSRFEHSVGVMLLLKKFGASLEEQVAGLLHDVSILALSHVADWVMGANEKEDYHDNIYRQFVMETEVPDILKRYNVALERTIDIKNFSLLERPLPNLCADRIDYALREFSVWTNPQAVSSIFQSLKAYNGNFVFDSQDVALIFAKTFLRCQNEHWGSSDAATRYYLLSNILKKALEKSIISTKDFYQNDDYLINKLEESNDEKIGSTLDLLLETKWFKPAGGRKGIVVRKKPRYVDPEILKDGKLSKLSKLNLNFAKSLEKQKELGREGIKIGSPQRQNPLVFQV